MSTAKNAEAPRETKPRRTRVFQWVPTDAQQHLQCEKAMLKPIEGNYEVKYVAGINTIMSKNTRFADRHTLLVHGFAGGVGQWVPNWNTLSKHTNLYAIDLPGFGRSVRDKRTKFDSEQDVIDYYVTCLDQWMDEMGLNGQVNIVGHSFGGYLTSFFAAHRPSRVRTLVLADPWGVPRPEEHKLPWKYRLLLAIGFKIGNPLSTLRGLGPWGPNLMPKYRKDFAYRWSGILEDPKVFYDYTYHSNAHGTCVGERAFAACANVDSGLYARRPLLDSVASNHPAAVPLYFVYGEDTWMDIPAGRALSNELRAKGCTTEVVTVEGAGHQVNVDNHVGFNDALIKLLFRQ